MPKKQSDKKPKKADKHAPDLAFIDSIAKASRVKPGKKISIRKYDTSVGEAGDILKDDRESVAKSILKHGIAELSEQQDRLYAADSWSLLVLFQAMDAAGKDGTIKHVLSGVNPQGCQVFSFKHPSTEELDHNFLWRYARAVPERGRIGIFNRSYYEDVLIVRVHPELVAAQRIPDVKVSGKLWKERYEDISAFERHLSRNGTKIVKFFLNVSKKEQRKRFLDRINDPAKNWKFGAGDLAERECWDDYMEAYEDAISATSSEEAPWYIVPADDKWITRAVVARVLVQTLQDLKLSYPKVSEAQAKEIQLARKALEK